jgi:hypothetical protein
MAEVMPQFWLWYYWMDECEKKKVSCFILQRSGAES